MEKERAIEWVMINLRLSSEDKNKTIPYNVVATACHSSNVNININFIFHLKQYWQWQRITCNVGLYIMTAYSE